MLAMGRSKSVLLLDPRDVKRPSDLTWICPYCSLNPGKKGLAFQDQHE